MKCFNRGCDYKAKSYTDLAQHIIDNQATHTNQGMLSWARRYHVGLRKPPERREPKVYKPLNGICPRCHKPFEKTGAMSLSEICQR